MAGCKKLLIYQSIAYRFVGIPLILSQLRWFIHDYASRLPDFRDPLGALQSLPIMPFQFPIQ